MRFSTLSLLSLCSLAAVVRAAETKPDKSIYSWANPTPDNLLRELATDRPDVTESPFTIDPGHVQIELDLVNYTRNRLDGVKTTEWGFVPFNLRFGISQNFEFGIFVTPQIRSTEQVRSGPKTTVSGVGDTIFRGKWNFWGNDGGETACGLIVDLKAPTAARDLGNNKVEGTALVSLNFDLTHGWSLGMMSGVGARHNGSRYRAIFTNTATLGRELAKDVDGYVEFTSEAGDGPHVCTFDTGLAWQFAKDKQVDLGVNFGVSRAAPDVLVFTGYSQRF